MISNPKFVFYACIAKGHVILGQFSNEEPCIESLAARCIEKTPPYHSMFSHTACDRTYTFVIHHPFTYFAIFHEDLGKSESLWFLNRVKCAFEDLIDTGSIKGFENVTSCCFQAHFDSIFAEIMALNLDLAVPAAECVEAESGKPRLDSSKERRSLMPLLGKPLKELKKKKRSPTEANGDSFKDDVVAAEKKVDMVVDDVHGVYYRESKNGLLHGGDHHRKVKQIWKKHVWVVLIMDMFVCAVLFVIWLCVCRGFRCIDG